MLVSNRRHSNYKTTICSIHPQPFCQTHNCNSTKHLYDRNKRLFKCSFYFLLNEPTLTQSSLNDVSSFSTAKSCVSLVNYGLSVTHRTIWSIYWLRTISSRSRSGGCLRHWTYYYIDKCSCQDKNLYSVTPQLTKHVPGPSYWQNSKGVKNQSHRLLPGSVSFSIFCSWLFSQSSNLY